MSAWPGALPAVAAVEFAGMPVAGVLLEGV